MLGKIVEITDFVIYTSPLIGRNNYNPDKENSIFEYYGCLSSALVLFQRKQRSIISCIITILIQ